MAEWREHQLGQLVADGALAISDGYRVRNVELGTAGIPFVRGGDIRDGWIDTGTIDHILPELSDRVQSKLACPGDIAFITKGTVGRAGRLRKGQPSVVFAPQVAYWRVLKTEVLNSDFLFYLIKSPAFQAALYGVKTRGAMVADYVSISLQHEFVFRFPGIGEQRAIAHILGTVDDKIELNRRMNETLEAMARALFKSWFVDFDPVRAKAEGRDPGLPRHLADLFPDSLEDSELGEIPQGWKVEDLGDILELAYGKALKAGDRRPGDVPVFGSNGQVGWHDEHLASGPGIVVGRKGNPGVVTWASKHFFVIDTAFYVIPKKCCPSLFFLFHVLQKHNLGALGADSAVPGLNRNVAYMSHQVVPPLSILKRFDSYSGSLAERANRCDQDAQALANLRDALLPKLVSGELRVKDAEKFIAKAL